MHDTNAHMMPMICRIPLLRPRLSRLVARPPADMAASFGPATGRAPEQFLALWGLWGLWGLLRGFRLSITFAWRHLRRRGLLQGSQSFAPGLALTFSLRAFLPLSFSLPLGCSNLSLCFGAQLLLRQRVHGKVIVLQLLQKFRERHRAS